VEIAVVGGTRFIGAYVVRLIAEHGHAVTVVHRGETEADLPESVRHVHVAFADLPGELARLRLGPLDVVLDMVPYLDKGGHGVLRFAGIADRAVVITSCDVYRAFGRLWRSEPGPPDRVPLTEDSPLRSLPAPDTGSEDVAYDNVEVERAVSGGVLPVTVLRLPATHGPGDPQHRLHRYLRQMDDARPAIVLGQRHAGWRWTRGYVENVADAIRLAIEDERAAGCVYNVADPTAYSESEWVRRIGEVVGWSGEVMAVPEDHLPESLRQPYDFTQDYVVAPTRIRTELGYREPIDEVTALERTIEWERRDPPAGAPTTPNYAAEDEALATYGRVSRSR
jgi:nucleoside-diphosphate-sugar epimerase